MSRVLAVLAVMWLVTLAGCSTRQYDADYDKAVAEYLEDAPFAVLQGQASASEFADGRVVARMPEGFAAVTPPPVVEGQPAVRLDASRLRPAFLETLPGHGGTSELVASTVEAVQMPISVAVWALTASGGSREALEKSLLDRARADESFGPWQEGWAWRDQPVQVLPRHRAANGDAGPEAWRVLSLEGGQPFETVGFGNREIKRVEAACELWLSAEPVDGIRTLMVWRVPKPVAGTLPMAVGQLAEAVARTVAIRRPAPAGEGQGPPANAPVAAPAAAPTAEPATNF